VGEVPVHLLVEGRVRFGVLVGLLQREDQRHQRLGDEAAAELSEMTALIGSVPEGVELGLFDHRVGACRGFRPGKGSACCRYESPDLVGVLHAGAFFNTRGDVNAIGAADADRFGNIGGVEPAR
jgi:hypothetical protein